MFWVSDHLGPLVRCVSLWSGHLEQVACGISGHTSQVTVHYRSYSLGRRSLYGKVVNRYKGDSNQGAPYKVLRKCALKYKSKYEIPYKDSTPHDPSLML